MEGLRFNETKELAPGGPAGQWRGRDLKPRLVPSSSLYLHASFFRVTFKGWRGQRGCVPLRGREAIPEWCDRVSGMGAVACVTEVTFGDACHMYTPTLVARCVCVCKPTWRVGDKLLWFAQDSPRTPSVPHSV